MLSAYQTNNVILFSVSHLSEDKWFEQIMTRETPFLDVVWKPLQYLQ